jgi:NADPH:quinone reductase-like Zn-dependent oxidoreductase
MKQKNSPVAIVTGATAGIGLATADLLKKEGYTVYGTSRLAQRLSKSLEVLKPGGKLISISGPPDPDFAKDQGSSWILRLVMSFLSYGIRKKAKRHGVNYSFLFMRASGKQLSEITSLIDSGVIRPVLDRVFPFESTSEGLAYVETGRAKGKVVVKVR